MTPLICACQASSFLQGQVLLASPGRNTQVSGSGVHHTSPYSRAHTYLTDQCRDGLFLIPDVIITSVPSSSGSPHTPGTTPNALSHLPTPAALSSESHTYLSQTTRPTPTAPHVTNSPRPANNYSHSSPSHVVQTASAADQPRDGHGGLQSATLHPAQGQSPGGRTGDSYGLSQKKREEVGTPTQFISKARPQLS